jgi:hypothetical protein
MDAAFWSELLQKVLVIALPPLVVAIVALVVAWINKVAKGLSADQMEAIREAVSMGVNFAEQTGLLKTGEQKKDDAIEAAQNYLAKQGITVDLALLDNMIEAAVKTELNWNKDLGPVAPPEPATPTLSMIPPVETGTVAPDQPKGEAQELAQG